MLFIGIAAQVLCLVLPDLCLETGSDRADLEGCRDSLVPLSKENCTEGGINRFRSFDGQCNNLEHPGWGAADMNFRRLLPPCYADGLGIPKGTMVDEIINGHPFPSARQVSCIRLRSTKIDDDDNFSTMMMSWGQFIDHDLDHALATISQRSNRSSSIYGEQGTTKDPETCNSSQCTGEAGLTHSGPKMSAACSSTCEFEPPCFAIKIPRGDPTREEGECIPFMRSTPVCKSRIPDKMGSDKMQRDQINTLNSYIDASLVYGVKTETAEKLRDLETGKLICGLPNPDSSQCLLPFNVPGVPGGCGTRPGADTCFSGGDERLNNNVALVALHTAFFRQHNLLVDQLRSVNPVWSGEQLYEEARRILGAFIQIITYRDYLPNILGREGMEKLGDYFGYNSSVDATILHEFSTAAFRFGHGMVSDVFTFSPDYITQEMVPFHTTLFNTEMFLDKGLDAILRGMATSKTKTADKENPMSTSMTEELFKIDAKHGSDLGALNIQRGRDHGLAPYIDYVEKCDGNKITEWDDLLPYMSVSVLDDFKLVYETVENIELFPGGMSEFHVVGACTGPTFNCILADTFKQVREGDRFWHANDQFSSAQLKELNKISLERIMCDTGDSISKIPPNVFRVSERPLVDCADLPGLDLSHWKI